MYSVRYNIITNSIIIIAATTMDVLTEHIVVKYMKHAYKIRDVKISGIPSVVLLWRTICTYTYARMSDVFNLFLSQFWTYKILRLQFTHVFSNEYTQHMLFAVLPSRGVPIARCSVCDICAIKKNLSTCKICGEWFCCGGVRFCGHREICYSHRHHFTQKIISSI
jgi:hypothetical protein